MQRSCSSANSPATRRISPASRSSARRDRCSTARLKDAGIERDKTYVTNAVKHFKFVPRGKIRIHQKPSTPEIRACRPWYEAELAPSGRRSWWHSAQPPRNPFSARPSQSARCAGRIIDADDGVQTLVTVHPSYLLRLPTRSQKNANTRASSMTSRSPQPLCARRCGPHSRRSHSLKWNQKASARLSAGDPSSTAGKADAGNPGSYLSQGWRPHGRSHPHVRLGADIDRQFRLLAVGLTDRGRSDPQYQIPDVHRLGQEPADDLQRRVPADPRPQAGCARSFVSGHMERGLGGDRADCAKSAGWRVDLHRELRAADRPERWPGNGLLHLFLFADPRHQRRRRRLSRYGRGNDGDGTGCERSETAQRRAWPPAEEYAGAGPGDGLANPEAGRGPRRGRDVQQATCSVEVARTTC